MHHALGQGGLLPRALHLARIRDIVQLLMQDFHVLVAEGRSHLARKAYDEAAHALVAAASHVLVAESDYATVMNLLCDALEGRGDARSALTALWYMAKKDAHSQGRASRLMNSVPAMDQARTRALFGDMAGAAADMESAGMLASAAIYHEKAGQHLAARALWSRLSQQGTRKPDGYVEALVHYNIARCSKRANESTSKPLRQAIRLLEEAADHFESIGQRERAFDCFQVLVQVGREGQVFEDVLEGYVNCIRILREDHLKYFALQYFEEAIRAARESTEVSAAATLAKEASEYARSIDLPAASTHYLLLHAELNRDVARHQRERGAPAEISENALLAAVITFGDLGQFARVGELYRQLAAMDLDPIKKAHYAKASQRYTSLTDARVEAGGLPSHLRQDNAFPEVWHLDVVEWEQAGNASEACADILLDPRWPDLLRRKALLARLTAFAAEGTKASGAEKKRLATELADLQLYGILAPLESLYAQGNTEVRVAVVTAMHRLSFKRTFTTVRDAAASPTPEIRAAAAKTIEALYFQHAFDPLSRLVRESSDPEIRSAAIRALARIDSQESAEFLLGTLDHGIDQDKRVIIDALKRARGATRFVALAKRDVAGARAPLQATLREILQHRGA